MLSLGQYITTQSLLVSDVFNRRKAKALQEEFLDQLYRTGGAGRLPAVEAACREALNNGAHSAPVVINILTNRAAPDPRTRGRLGTLR